MNTVGFAYALDAYCAHQKIFSNFANKHMRDCIRAHCMAVTYCEPLHLCEWLLENSYLTLPEGDRRGGLMTVVIAAKLPNS